MTHPSSVPDPDVRKRVFFCPRCGHASDIDGDWSVRREAERAVLSCPDCEAVVTTHPQPSPGAA
ncbi:phage terminase large subunit family protein [Natrononativus amylolyticus]|uniref:phage terminase large subunit family protein n=1 Tax=Natrononativus amylolyticus TaxID=2963434 RepID=UPI0020CE4E40|nr:phage terminase large subunit family protein [Natrononativus amylolyticus]